MPSIPDIACETSVRRDLFTPAGPVVALVSGGGDSVALLRLLVAGELGATGPVSVLHLDHQLRAESGSDAAFVSDLCATLGVPCSVVHFDVGAYAQEVGLNLEDAGRRLRYRFAEEALDAACDAAGVSRQQGRIVTAHSRDDAIETFFMRALTGAGAGGLASIPHRRGRIVRPLLDCDREAIRAWLRELGQPWREDASNSDITRLRALIRAELVPLAERVNPAFRATLARSMSLVADDDALLSRMAADFGRDFTEIEPGPRVVFSREWMATLDRAMARRAVRSALLASFPEASRLEASHIEALVDGLGSDSFARDLPGGLRGATEYGKLVVSRTGEALAPVAPSLLPIPGTAELGSAGRVIAEEVDPADISDSPYEVTVSADTLVALTVDSVRPGDRMQPLGMSGSRKLSDLLIDAKVPRRERETVPVVRDSGEIVWLAGVRMSERYRIGPDTRRAVRLTWQRMSQARPTHEGTT